MAGHRKYKKAGFTLVEVVVSLLLVMIVAAAIVQSVVVARRITHVTAQRVAAFGMCRAQLERVRSIDYADVIQTNFTNEPSLRFQHLGGKHQNTINCSRDTTITELNDPDRKEILVTVAWAYFGKTNQEFVLGTLYEK